MSSINDDYGINDDYSGFITNNQTEAIDNNVPFTLQDDNDEDITPKQ